MNRLYFPSRLRSAQNRVPLSRLSSCPSAPPASVTFVTLANHQRQRPSAPASPTKPAPVNKIHSRAQQLAGHLHSTPLSTMASKYTARKIGAPNTLEHRIYIEKDGVPVSPFHDIPLYANEQQTVLNMVVEVPRWTNAKMEVCVVPPPYPRQLPRYRGLTDVARRSPRRRRSTPSSRISRRASSAT